MKTKILYFDDLYHRTPTAYEIKLNGYIESMKSSGVVIGVTQLAEGIYELSLPNDTPIEMIDEVTKAANSIRGFIVKDKKVD